MGPVMVPAVCCDWCGRCLVVPAHRARDVLGEHGPVTDLAVRAAGGLGWTVEPGRVLCPSEPDRDPGQAPVRTLTSLER